MDQFGVLRSDDYLLPADCTPRLTLALGNTLELWMGG